jgi:hypothetical protein
VASWNIPLFFLLNRAPVFLPAQRRFSDNAVAFLYFVAIFICLKHGSTRLSPTDNKFTGKIFLPYLAGFISNPVFQPYFPDAAEIIYFHADRLTGAPVIPDNSKHCDSAAGLNKRSLGSEP